MNTTLFWYLYTKGQVILKGLFSVLEFSQKMNEWICGSTINEFLRSFFGRIQGYQNSFWNYLTFSGSNFLANQSLDQKSHPFFDKISEDHNTRPTQFQEIYFMIYYLFSLPFPFFSPNYLVHSDYFCTILTQDNLGSITLNKNYEY